MIITSVKWVTDNAAHEIFYLKISSDDDLAPGRHQTTLNDNWHKSDINTANRSLTQKRVTITNYNFKSIFLIKDGESY